jgi:hypothetical protein
MVKREGSRDLYYTALAPGSPDVGVGGSGFVSGPRRFLPVRGRLPWWRGRVRAGLRHRHPGCPVPPVVGPATLMLHSQNARAFHSQNGGQKGGSSDGGSGCGGWGVVSGSGSRMYCRPVGAVQMNRSPSRVSVQSVSCLRWWCRLHYADYPVMPRRELDRCGGWVPAGATRHNPGRSETGAEARSVGAWRPATAAGGVSAPQPAPKSTACSCLKSSRSLPDSRSRTGLCRASRNRSPALQRIQRRTRHNPLVGIMQLMPMSA